MTGPTEGVLLRAVLFGGAVLLAAGGLLHLADLAVRGNAAWGFTGAVGAVWSGVLVVDALRSGRVGVDAIAVIAIVGALLVGELFAAALITLMLATGRLLEARAAGRARAELSALVARAPVDARATRTAASRWCRWTLSAPATCYSFGPVRLCPLTVG